MYHINDQEMPFFLLLSQFFIFFGFFLYKLFPSLPYKTFDRHQYRPTKQKKVIVVVRSSSNDSYKWISHKEYLSSGKLTLKSHDIENRFNYDGKIELKRKKFINFLIETFSFTIYIFWIWSRLYDGNFIRDKGKLRF